MSNAIDRLLKFCWWKSILKILVLPNRVLNPRSSAPQTGILPLDQLLTFVQGRSSLSSWDNRSYFKNTLPLVSGRPEKQEITVLMSKINIIHQSVSIWDGVLDQFTSEERWQFFVHCAHVELRRYRQQWVCCLSQSACWSTRKYIEPSNVFYLLKETIIYCWYLKLFA